MMRRPGRVEPSEEESTVRWPVQGRIALRDLDRDAVKVVRRLTRHGYTAYLVGGCVRDLLLGRRPKDFDIATDARPRQVKRLFRNSRIIGRRFRLVHITFSDQVLEISTFRAKAEAPADAQDLMIRHDNTFGSPEEDAERRDFTVNGLFYDLESEEVLDYVGGLEDLQRGILRTIGDPWVRFQEDPVRMMRAIKFAGRLGLRLDDHTYQAILDCRDDILKAASPRILEEILRLLNRGGASGSMRLLFKTGLLHALLPEISQVVEESLAEGVDIPLWGYLNELDRWVAAGEEVSSALLLAILFSAPAQEMLFHREADNLPRVGRLADRLEEAMRPVALRLHMPKRDAYRARQILIAQRRMTAPTRQGKRSSVRQLMNRDYFPEAFFFLRLHQETQGGFDEQVREIEEHCRARWPDRPLPGDCAPARKSGRNARPATVRRRVRARSTSKS